MTMRILLSGYHNPHYWTVTEYIERAISALGHELAVFDDGTRCIPGRLRDRSRWMERVDRAWLNRRLQDFTRRIRPDVLLVLGGELIEPETVHLSKAEGAAAILWTIDAPWNFEPVLRRPRFTIMSSARARRPSSFCVNPGSKGPAGFPWPATPDATAPPGRTAGNMRNRVTASSSWGPIIR